PEGPLPEGPLLEEEPAAAGGEAEDDEAAEEAVAPAGRPRGATSWTANLQLERLLATGMFACVAWSLTQALRTAGMRTSQAVAIFLWATVFFAAGAALGGRPDGRNYRRYTDYGVMDWILLLIPIVLVLRLLPSLLDGPPALVQDVSSWMDEPWRFWNA